MKNIFNINIILAAIIIGSSIIVAGYFISQSNFANNQSQTLNYQQKYDEVLDIEQASKYLKISKEEIRGIIALEENTPNIGKAIIPYFKVNGKYLFSKDKIDKWLVETIDTKTEYDMSKMQINTH